MESSEDTKLGLALSGGGFRSAIFHVGVLARLAELDLLRKVDVISSVSGGSIIAAYYYLKVKALLEKNHADGQDAPGREAYIRMVAEIEIDFLEAVQRNMLIRMFLDPIKNARMMAEGYSNTERFADLLTTYFFQPILQDFGSRTKNDKIKLKNITIQPLAVNRLPDTRAPFLIINSTSLNTGHLWQFTSASVGEQPVSYEAGNEPIEFFKTFRFNDDRLTIEQQKIIYNITLGQAVAASCSVPGIFEPLQIRNLYTSEGEYQTIRLVDGGLVDNQGLASLFAENCTHIICSDASDILQLEHNPSVQFLDVALRANDILMERIRSKSVNQLFGFGAGRFALFDLGDSETRGHIFPADSEQMVRALTRIRTNLDSFSDREAYSLMYYGYRLSLMEMENKGFEMIRKPLPDSWDWRFLEIKDHLFYNDAIRKDLLLHLEAGSRQIFKLFMLKKVIPYVILLPIPILIVMLTLYLIMRSSLIVFWGIMMGAVLVVVYTQNQRLLKIMDNVSILRRMKQRILKTLVSLNLPEPFSYMLALGSWIQLTVFDRLFLRYGRIRRTSGKSGTKRQGR